MVIKSDVVYFLIISDMILEDCVQELRWLQQPIEKVDILATELTSIPTDEDV